MAMQLDERVLRYAPWSYSKVGTLSCGSLFSRKYIKKEAETLKAQSSRVGIVAHSVLEAGLLTPGIDLEQVYRELVVKSELTREEQVDCSAKLPGIKDFLTRIEQYKIDEGVTEEFIEHKLAFNVDLKPIDFFDKTGLMRAVLDLGMRTRDDYVTIIDHKSGKKQPIHKHTGQLYTYMLMAIIAWPWAKGVLSGIHYIGEPKVDWFPSPNGAPGAWTRKDIATICGPWIQQLLQGTSRKLAQIETGGPAPETSWACGWCGYLNSCSAGQAYKEAQSSKRKLKVTNNI